MNTIKQISVFVENTVGRLAEITKILGEAGLNLRALIIADTADFGILRIIVDDTEHALKVFNETGLTTTVTEVLGVEIPDKPGELAKVMEIFEANNVNIEYLYASLEKRSSNTAVIIFKVEDIDYGLKIVQNNNLKTVQGFSK